MTSYVSGASLTPLLGDTIGANLERTVGRFPDADAIVSCHQDIRWTYAELDARIDLVARGLLDMGLAKGDRVGLWSPNYAEWAVVQYATAKIGVILVNLNPAYRTHELEYAVGQSGCRLVISAPAYKTSDYGAMLAEVRGSVATLERTVLLWSPEWDGLLSAGESVPVDRLRTASRALDADDAINIQYTSGTTGFPKGATLSHHNILNNGYFVGEGCGYTEADRICVPVPYYHCFGMVMGNLAATSHGSCVVLPSPTFEPAAVLRAVQEERCTSLYGVPTMFIGVLADPAFASSDLTSLRTGIMAGAPCPVEVMKRCVSEMHMEEVTICYGMTETSPVSTQTAAADPASWTRSAARRSSGGCRASCAPVDTRSCSATGRIPTAPPRPSTAPAGCTPATWPPSMPTGTSTSSAGSRT
jgi:fatty-acyl-CoA synthase